MNRKQRRAARKAEPRYVRGLTREQRAAKLARNGITVEDLDKACAENLKRGIAEGEKMTYRTIYAAVCLALNELHGFGSKRCADVLKRADQIALESLGSGDLMDGVWERMKLRLDFDQPFDRIEEVDE